MLTHDSYPTIVPVTIHTTPNVYHYDAFKLLLSYGIAILFTVLSTIFGIYSFYVNGVEHFSSFSALIATTRNPDLDILSEGHSLGALPLDSDVANVRLRFGVLVREERGTTEDGAEGGEHIGFGLAERVVKIKRGGAYV